MDYLGPADLTLIYRSHGGEKSATCSGIHVTLFFNEPHRHWTVMLDDPTDQAPLDGLIRAVVSLPDGRRSPALQSARSSWAVISPFLKT
jgi:hypothetical protein